jgi:hypothetical protein
MGTVTVRAYAAPTMVLLAFDWDEAPDRPDFLGFQIVRHDPTGDMPLLNRLTFDGPAQGADVPTNEAPIQKFMWWDAGVREPRTYEYHVTPMCGDWHNPTAVNNANCAISVDVPDHVVDGIGTWFNRAVVSSQAFSKLLEKLGIDTNARPLVLAEDIERQLRAWLADDLEKLVPSFLGTEKSIEGAIYHLTDGFWIIPALKAAANKIELVYDAKELYAGKDKPKNPSPNEPTVTELADKANIQFEPRVATNIMHDKFLVQVATDGKAERLLCGSANFTSSGLSSQANLLHTFDCPELASVFLDRKRLIQSDPSVAATANGAAWSNPVSHGGASIRAFFSPEPGKERVSIDTVVQAIGGAQQSVVFCLFDPTDEPLLHACFALGDVGKMMFGLVNRVPANDPASTGNTPVAGDVLIYNRSHEDMDVVPGYGSFYGTDTPQGFLKELAAFPGEGSGKVPPVVIHHKFIVIDGETNSPTIYSGSANMSNNSIHRNDEALLEIKDSPRLAQLYLAEFMRLYENYRARAKFHDPAPDLALIKDSSWCKKYFVAGSPEEKARIAMSSAI